MCITLQIEMVISLQNFLPCEQFLLSLHVFGVMGGLVKSPPLICGSHFLD